MSTSSYVMPNPSDIRTYTPEQRRRHRLRRALNELMGEPHYRLRVVDGGLVIRPRETITPEARAFIQQYRSDLIQHCQWLGETE